jgi:hypothetical protein
MNRKSVNYPKTIFKTFEKFLLIEIFTAEKTRFPKSSKKVEDQYILLFYSEFNNFFANQ